MIISPKSLVITSASLALCVVSAASVAEAGLLVNPGFETVEPIGTFWPNRFGDWNGDRATVVEAEKGITPLEGIRMLRFDYAAPHPYGATNLGASQVLQLIDGSKLGDLSSGTVTYEVSAWFNRVAGDSQTDTLFMLELQARTGSPSSFPSDNESGRGLLARNAVYLYSDDDPTTWEYLSTTLVLPAATDFAVVQLAAIENVYNDTWGAVVEFDGHFADQVSLSRFNAVPEPQSLAVWMVLCGGIIVFSFARPSGGDGRSVRCVVTG